MSGFKLLAIRPLKGCDKKFLKNLNEGVVYRFYNDYTFYNNSGNEHNIKGDVAKIKLDSIVPDDLYKINDINLNISAVVGKNGSGKSSLIELIFVSAFLLAMQEDILNNHSKKDENIKDTLKHLKSEHKLLTTVLESFFKNNEYVKKNSEPNAEYEKEIIESVYHKLNLDQRIKWKNDEINKLSKLIEEHNHLKKVIKVEIYYQISQTVFKLRIHPDKKEKSCQIEIVPTNFSHLETDGFKEQINRNIKLDNLLKNPLDLSEIFFYSLVLNYSQYALNSMEIGNWIIELFHKNDGYQTPIVINPMRTEGNFDINTENELVKQRLLVNILTPLEKNEKVNNSLRHLAQDKIAHRIKITLNKDKFKNKNGDEELKVFTDYSEEWKIIEDKLLKVSRKTTTEWDHYAKDYIITKLISMADKYPPYYGYYVDKKLANLDKYLDDLMDDDSHVAYKFHQAINYLKYDYATLYFNSTKSKSVEVISNKLKGTDKNLKHLIPPSFLTVDILFEEKESEDKDKIETNTLQNLSSGEKQYIYSISSIMYHLRYLDSVKLRKGDDENAQIKLNYKYQYINLVFDEIELYYHPELQRQFIFDFRNAIERCKLNSIKNINCTFITHSPFILSDIPAQNILRLEDGKPSIKNVEETFGANIHNLLANDFFLENGFMGEFAKEKINEIITFLNHEQIEKKFSSLDKEKDKEEISRLEKQKTELETKSSELTLDNCQERILLIGEPAIRETLLRQYYAIIDTDKKRTNSFFERLAEELNYNISKKQ